MMRKHEGTETTKEMRETKETEERKRMKKTKQTKHKPSARLLTLLLAFTMVFTMMPGMVWADEGSVEARGAEVIEVDSQADLAKIGGCKTVSISLLRILL